MQEFEIKEKKIFSTTSEFELIFKELYKPLVRYCCTIITDRQDAEDIVQHVFVALWQKVESIEINTSIKSYLYKMVHNTSLNRLKHNQVKLKYQELANTSHLNIVYQENEGTELKKQIELSLEKLPEQCRKIFMMSRFEGLKYQQIADTLGLSIKTIENQMGKALKIMRENLKDYITIFILFII